MKISGVYILGKIKKVKFLTIIVTLLLTFVTINQVHAASGNIENGFYINGAIDKKFYSLDELFTNTDEVVNSINDAGFENIYYVQDGELNTLEGLFNNDPFVPIRDGLIPAGTYKSTSGSIQIGTGTDIFEVISIQ